MNESTMEAAVEQQWFEESAETDSSPVKDAFVAGGALGAIAVQSYYLAEWGGFSLWSAVLISVTLLVALPTFAGFAVVLYFVRKAGRRRAPRSSVRACTPEGCSRSACMRAS